LHFAWNPNSGISVAKTIALKFNVSLSRKPDSVSDQISAGNILPMVRTGTERLVMRKELPSYFGIIHEFHDFAIFPQNHTYNQ
jgi:hypothetical protein